MIGVNDYERDLGVPLYIRSELSAKISLLLLFKTTLGVLLPPAYKSSTPTPPISSEYKRSGSKFL